MGNINHHKTECSNDDLKVPQPVILFIIFLSSFICYHNTLGAEFVYDDQRAILTNQDLLPTSSWSNLLYNDFWGTPLSHSGSHKSYRPLCVFTYRVNYYFGELNPWGYHLVNNVLHCIVSCLFAYLCNILYNKRWLMLLGGIMFSLHPIHTEAVAGIVGRADLGAALFFLLAILSYQKATCKGNSTNIFWFLTCMFNSFCALYTKEQGVTVLGVCIVYEVLIVSSCNLAHLSSAMQKLYVTGGLRRIIVLSIYSVSLIYSRLLIMGYSPPSFSPFDNPAANHPDMMTRFFTFAYLPFCNLYLLLYPFRLSYDWSSLNSVPLVEKICQFENLLSLSLYIGLLLIAYWYLKFCRKHHTLLDGNYDDKSPTQFDETNFLYHSLNRMIFQIACMILPFIPATNLLFYVGFVIAERILYIPSVGFCLLIVNGLHLLLKFKRRFEMRILIAMSCILIMFSVKTYVRNFDWLNEEALYRSGLVTSPAKSWGNLANIYNKQNRYEEAEKAYKTALNIIPTMGDTNYNLGLMLQNLARYEEAIKYYNNAIHYRPTLAAAYLGLGVTLQKIGKKMDALQIFKKAYNISDRGLKDPRAHQIYLTHIRDHTGRILFELGHNKEAVQVFLDAIKRMPVGYEPASIYNMLGQCFSALNNKEVAESWYVKSLSSKSDHVPALLTYAKHLSNNDFRRSKELLQKALSIEPNRTESLLLYATLLKDHGKSEEALKLLNRAYKVDKNDFNVLSQLSAFYREIKDYQKSKVFQIELKKLRPDDVSIRTNLGALYHMLGELNEASFEYNEALDVDPNDPILIDNMKRLKRAMTKRR